MKDRQYNDKKEKVKWNNWSTNYTEKIDQHEPHKKLHVNSDAMEGLAVPASVGDIHRITFKRYKHHLFQTVMLTKFYIMYQWINSSKAISTHIICRQHSHVDCDFFCMYLAILKPRL